MSIAYVSLAFMWQGVIIPRIGDVYVFGGSLNPDAVNQGTDCTGCGSEVNEALLYGTQMNWQRQFWTGTFAGANPGDTGPFGGVDATSEWVCIESPSVAPPGTVAIFAVLQLSDPSEAHMVCAVLDPLNVTGFNPTLDPTVMVGIESGGSYTDADGNSTLHIGNEATSINDPMFNQWFALPGPLLMGPGPAPVPAATTYIVKEGDTFFTIAEALGVSLATLEAANPQIADFNMIFAGEPVNVPGGPPPHPPWPPITWPIPISFVSLGPASGVDYSGARLSGASVAAERYQFAIRYLSSGGTDLPAKQLQRSEAADLLANRVDLVSNWETTADMMLRGFSAGVLHGKLALSQHFDCGGPGYRPIYFSADFAATPDQYPQIDAYLRGVASVIGLAWTGVYGDADVLLHCFQAGTATWFWQTQGWSNGQQTSHLHILQDNDAGQVTIDGTQCDLDNALVPDYGQWSAAVAPAPPAPVVVTAPPVPAPVPPPAPPAAPAPAPVGGTPLKVVVARSHAIRTFCSGIALAAFWGVVSVIGDLEKINWFSKTGLISVVSIAVTAAVGGVAAYALHILKPPSWMATIERKEF
jgi:hypothetical protein